MAIVGLLGNHLLMNRMSVQEVKEFWFQNDLIIYAEIGGNDKIAALPKIEAERANSYLSLLKSCHTLEDAQNLFYEFERDRNKPKLIPRIKNVLDMGDFLAEEWMELQGVPRHQIDFESELYEKIPGNFEIFNELKDHPFIWNQSTMYLDESGTFDACRNFEIWTDNWIPLEIARKIGAPDLGYGIDYYEAEYVYRDFDAFEKEFTKYGFSIDLHNTEIKDLLHVV